MSVDGERAAAVRIARSSRDDVALVAPLFDAYRRFYGAESDLAGAERFLATRIARDESVILVARCEQACEGVGDGAGDGAIGFAQLYPCFSSVAMRGTFIVNDLFIAREWRGRGVGRQLIEAAAAFATQAGAAALEIATHHDNRAALALYESAGFVRDTYFTHLTRALSEE